MARESQTLAERLNASEEQLARDIANASGPKVMPEEPIGMNQPVDLGAGQMFPGPIDGVRFTSRRCRRHRARSESRPGFFRIL